MDVYIYDERHENTVELGNVSRISLTLSGSIDLAMDRAYRVALRLNADDRRRLTHWLLAIEKRRMEIKQKAAMKKRARLQVDKP